MIVEIKDIEGPAHLRKAWNYAANEKKKVHVWGVNLNFLDGPDDLDLALREFEITRSRNTRSKKPKALHQLPSPRRTADRLWSC